MNFKKWILKETETSTADIAGFSRMTLPLIRRSTKWWEKPVKKGGYMVPQLSESSAHSYSCVMFYFPTKIKNEIKKWSLKNVAENKIYDEEGYGRDSDSHVTILYGLHSSEPDSIKETVSKFKKDEIKFLEISKFESKEYDVLKFGMSGKLLHNMNSALKKLPYTSNFPDYKPHCTIAYVKKGSCDALIGKNPLKDLKLEMDNVTFSSFEDDVKKFNLS